MKATLKLTVLLGVVVALAGATLWWRHAPTRLDEMAAAPQTSRTEALPPAAPGRVRVVPALVPESLRPIMAVGAVVPFAERVKRVHALPVALTAEEIQSFYAYLRSPSPTGAENRDQENWLRNEMMDKLAETPTLPAGLAGVLVAIYRDPAQDLVMRDYAVQHVTPVYARASAEEKATLQQILWSAVAETDSSIAGTALLALRDLATDHREIQANKLGEAALKLAVDDHCGELSRITALQVCGRLGLNQAAPLLLQLARNPGSVSMQIAAIAALGDVGNQEARNYLRQLAIHSESRLLPALETALKKLNGRLGI